MNLSKRARKYRKPKHDGKQQRKVEDKEEDKPNPKTLKRKSGVKWK